MAEETDEDGTLEDINFRNSVFNCEDASSMEFSIREIWLAKALKATNLRLSCSQMSPKMSQRQESAIKQTFSNVNLFLATSSYYWEKGIISSSLLNRAKAVLAERIAIKKYTALVISEACFDAQMCVNWAQSSWKDRVASDVKVVCETRAMVNMASPAGCSAVII